MSLEEDGMKLAPGKEHSSSGAKKKSKGCQSHGVQGAEVPNDSLTSDSSFVPKNKKSTHGSNYLSKSEVGDFKLQTDYGKARDRYKDFFGDIELEQEDNDVDSVEMSSDDRLKDSDVIGKSTLTFNSTPKERFYGPGTMAPLVKEDWVCCDKCQKWRLLPFGTNPDSLPEKWLCSMLNWLPGMNRCSISEEETTKALIAPITKSAPESQNSLHVHPGGVVSGVTSSDARLFYQNHENVGSHAIPSGGKKKQGLKEVSNATNQDGTTQFPNSLKKNLQASVKSRSLYGVNQSPPVNELDSQNLSKSSIAVVEKHRHKQKEKNKPLEHYSEGGIVSEADISCTCQNH
ncbi:hypothetical protein F0562_033880 [Nyssa sinensis]|uniref:CW-type domain-containing protein n=1 Tax=Nyssa sinensis TaxID=561372 RepID=A0A5J5AJH4_9ASTE|nr:hypothetical protein F0562_033880 [Nyssa sinensis]